MPKNLPLYVVIKTLIVRVYKALRSVTRTALSLVIWLVLLPTICHMMYQFSFSFGRQISELFLPSIEWIKSFNNIDVKWIELIEKMVIIEDKNVEINSFWEIDFFRLNWFDKLPALEKLSPMKKNFL